MVLLNPAVGSHNVGAKPRTPRLGDFCAELARRPSQPHHTIILMTGTLRMTPLGRACKLLLWASHPRCARRPAPYRSAVLRCKLELRHGSRVVRCARPALGLDRRRRSARSTAHAGAYSRCGCRRCDVMRGGATMKPSNFEFARATSLAEAATILRQAAGSARVVAGGQSLGPMLNLRLVQPSILVDITAIPELTRIDEDADGVIVGACVTTSDIEDGRVRVEELPILASVAGGVAYRAVRNRGTIGGSICHADPAGDWLPTLCALAAECIVTDGRRARRIPIDQFVIGAFEVMLEPGELLQAIRIPRPSRTARCGYYKVCRKAGEFALASGAVLLDRERERFRAVMGATQGRPIVIEDARRLLGAIPQRGMAVRLHEEATNELLQGTGLPVNGRVHATALARAAAQAMA